MECLGYFKFDERLKENKGSKLNQRQIKIEKLVKEAFAMIKHGSTDYASLRDFRVLHFALNNLWQAWMAHPDL